MLLWVFIFYINLFSSCQNQNPPPSPSGDGSNGTDDELFPTWVFIITVLFCFSFASIRYFPYKNSSFTRHLKIPKLILRSGAVYHKTSFFRHSANVRMKFGSLDALLQNIKTKINFLSMCIYKNKLSFSRIKMQIPFKVIFWFYHCFCVLSVPWSIWSCGCLPIRLWSVGNWQIWEDWGREEGEKHSS